MSTVLNKKKAVNVDIFLLLLCFLSQTSDELTTMIMRQCRVAELGSLSSGAKMAMKIFVRRVFIIFATNALFLCPKISKKCVNRDKP